MSIKITGILILGFFKVRIAGIKRIFQVLFFKIDEYLKSLL